MPATGRGSRRVRFEGFELDLLTGELRREGGDPFRLSEQPLRVLAALVERPGELVLREELRKRLWPNDTVVEFEHSIASAMNRLRQALGDSAENPRFIETLARRGYRWKAAVEWVDASRAERAPTAATAGQNLVGKKVAHYRVLEVIGGGGMGLVYKAEDLKLGRRVALKFLPEEMATDPVALERFRREARAASAADHRNICVIHEIGKFEGAPFIAMQFLEGSTLRERIEQGEGGAGPLPAKEIVAVALQVADGLDAVHREGIFHRDIKPANIFVTTRGEVKILDFGLAKLGGAEPGEPSAENTDGAGEHPADVTLTRIGAALGTASYMSPEQVRGEKLDARTDLFSLGLVLYEMATGQRAFPGASASDVHEAVLRQGVAPVRDWNPAVPEKLEAIIEKAIRKDRESRYQSAAEMRADLAAMEKAQARRTEQSGARERARRLWWPALAAAGIAALVAGGTLWLGRRAPTANDDLKMTQLTYNTSEIPVRSAALSPDGTYLAYADRSGIHVKVLATNEVRSLPQPESLAGQRVDWWIAAWFPDGVRFVAQISPFGEGCLGCTTGSARSTWVASVMGGVPHKIRDDSVAESVSPDGGTIAFTVKLGNPGGREIWLMDADGGHARLFARADENSWMRYARWSPDGKRLAYILLHEAGGKPSTLESRGVDGAPPAILLANADAVEHDYAWLTDGNVLYGKNEPGGNGCNYWKLKVDTRTGTPDGEPRKVTHWAGFCVDSTSATADGKKLAFTEPREDRAIYVAELQNGGARIVAPRRLTLIEGLNSPAGWTNDGKSVIFSSSSAGAAGLYRQALDSDTAVAITRGTAESSQWALTPDGESALYLSEPPGQEGTAVRQVMRVSLAGGPVQAVASGPVLDLTCARLPSKLCLMAEVSASGEQMALYALDPVAGRGEEIIRAAVSRVRISPDGRKVALFNGKSPVRVLTLADREIRELNMRNWSGLVDHVSWAGDSRGMFMGSAANGNAVLLYVDTQGRSRAIWEQRGSLATRGIPSPDGRYLAMEGWSLSSNVWMLENF